MKRYKKADNCGPVPYPDGSGRMLADEIVSGEEWAPLLGLGFVVEVDAGMSAKVVTSQKTPGVRQAKPKIVKKGKPLKPKTSVIKNNKPLSVIELAMRADAEGPAEDGGSVIENAIMTQKSATKSADISGALADGQTAERGRADTVDRSSSGGADTKGPTD